MKAQITDFQPQKGTKKHEKLRRRHFCVFLCLFVLSTAFGIRLAHPCGALPSTRFRASCGHKIRMNKTSSYLTFINLVIRNGIATCHARRALRLRAFAGVGVD